MSDIYDIDDIKKQLVKTTLLGVFSRIEKPINEEQIQHLKNIANDAARVLTIPNDEIKTLSQDDVNTLIYYFNEDQIKQLTPEQARNIPKNIIDTLVINNALAITNRASAPEPTEGGRRRTLGRRSRK